MIIRANYRKMNDSLKRLYEIAGKIGEELERLIEQINNLEIFWDGYANEEYLIRFNADLGYAEILLEKSKETAVLIKEALEKYQKGEQEITEKINSLHNYK